MTGSAVDPAALECARCELENPTDDAARRFAHGPAPRCDASGRPLVARALPLGDDAAMVWFVGLHYPLNLAVEVGRDGPGGAWRVTFAQADAHARVALRIVSDALAPDAITAVLGLAPTREAPAGRSFDGEPVARAEHLWLRDVLPDSPAPVEEKLTALLDLVEPHGGMLADLLAGSDGATAACVSVAYHADAERMQGLALAPDTLARLGALGLALDLDLYTECLGAGSPTPS